MKTTITKSMFRDAFRDCGRQDNFTYEGLGHLYDYFVQFEEDCNHEIELDVIAICCEYNEESIEDALGNYGLASMDELESHTSVVWHDDTDVIYQAY